MDVYDKQALCVDCGQAAYGHWPSELIAAERAFAVQGWEWADVLAFRVRCPDCARKRQALFMARWKITPGA